MEKQQTSGAPLSREAMESLLPEYAFGNASLADQQAFEASLPLYPDLAEEVEQVRAVFAKVDELELPRQISQKTRNLSVHVLERRREQRQRFWHPGRIRRLMPLALASTVACICLVVLFPPQGTIAPVGTASIAEHTTDGQDANSSDQMLQEILSDEDWSVDDLVLLPANDGILNIESEDLASLDDDEDVTRLAEATLIALGETTSMPFSDQAVEDLLEDLNEDDLQSLFKELENDEVL